MGVIEVELFEEEVDSLEDPKVVKFRKLLEQVAKEYQCKLVSFRIDRGTVSFSFDDDALHAEILRLLSET